VAVLRSFQGRVRLALGHQRNQRRELPALTQRLLESRSALAAGIERLRLAANLAFLGEPKVRKEFRKGLQRKRKAQGQAVHPAALSSHAASPTGLLAP
jgi:hypothetical protein